jgi:drug/metabolite transporter (DMT)-like permease
LQRAYKEKKMRLRAMLVLLGGILVVSSSSLLIRGVQGEGMSSLVISAGRLLIASLILTPIAFSRVGPEIRALSRREIALGVLSGVFLAIHFYSWISSLAFTSVASSVALVSTNPLWVGLASVLIFRERLGKAAIAGIILTIIGSVMIGFSDSSDPSGGSNPILGDILALIGAITVSGYLLIGRTLRRTLSIVAYIWLVYTSAALILLLLVLLSGQQVFGFSPLAYMLLICIALGPQLLGHTSFNWAIKYLSATFIAVATLGEPIASAILAVIFLGELFVPLQLAGFIVLLIGIIIAARSEQQQASDPPPQTVSS